MNRRDFLKSIAALASAYAVVGLPSFGEPQKPLPDSLANEGTLTFDFKGGINDGKWHHHAVTWSGQELTCYIDGAKVGTDSFSAIQIASSPDTFESVHLNDMSETFNGTAIFGRPLSSDEIAEIAIT